VRLLRGPGRQMIRAGAAVASADNPCGSNGVTSVRVLTLPATDAVVGSYPGEVSPAVGAGTRTDGGGLMGLRTSGAGGRPRSATRRPGSRIVVVNSATVPVLPPPRTEVLLEPPPDPAETARPHRPGRPQLPHRAGFDGLRALAVIGVLLYHADIGWAQGGFLGVDLFFVLSGFLITSLLVQEVATSGRISLLRFYRRRARRLLPALFVMLAVSMTAMLLFWPGEAAQVRGDMLGAILYVANWWFIGHHLSYFQSIGRPSPFQHLWSLGVEEQFYLVWPVCVLLMLRGRATARRLATVGTVALVGALASTGWMAYLAVRGDVPFRTDSSRVYFGTDTHAMGLMIGAAAAVALVLLRRSPRRARLDSRAVSLAADVVGGAAVVGLCLAMAMVSEFSTALYRGGFLWFSLLAVVAVVVADRAVGRFGRVLGWSPLQWVGTRSYGLYLWHWPIFVFSRPQLDVHVPWLVDLVFRLTLTALLSELSYRYVEQPIRRNGIRAWVKGLHLQRLAAVSRRALAAVVLGPLVLLLVLAQFVAVPATPSLGATHVRVSPATVSVGLPQPLPHGRRGRLPLAVGPPPPLRWSMTAIGDSVMLGAADQIAAAFPGAVVNAQEGRQPYTAIDLVWYLLRHRRLGHVVVLQTGNNGIIDPVALDGLLRALAGRKVLLVNDFVPRAWEGPNNALLARAAATHRGVVLVNWRADATGHPGWFWSDGVHLRPAGVIAYVTLLQHALL
jgi:peptidoglycan/LPS O-acetylase OafA/YrhL